MKKKKRRKKRNKRRILLLLLFLIVLFFLIFKLCTPTNKGKWDIIQLDFNEQYAGIGKQKIKDANGYFTTFTTIDTNKKVYKEYKQNGTTPWSEKFYWDGTMADNGCGITAMSIILSGYGKSDTPEDLRKRYYPVIDHDELSKELSLVFGIDNSDFFYDSYHLSNTYIEEYLKTNRPILICVWNKPKKNRWTTASHYMVLLAVDNNKKVYVSNPNGLEESYKSSGWYPIEEITPYIAKALFIETF